MVDRVSTAIVHGFTTQLVSVEAHMSSGIPQINVIGLADQTIREAKDRLIIALTELGIKLGNKKFIVSLNPTDIKKQGGHLDLPMAIALLKASKILPESRFEVGALAGVNLSGDLIETNEIFSLLSSLATSGCSYIIVPKSALYMGRFFQNIRLVGLENLSEVVTFLKKNDASIEETLKKYEEVHLNQEILRKRNALNEDTKAYEEVTGNLDFFHVKGQEVAKRAIIIALAGHHHLLMYGPPGTGKSMLAYRIPSIQRTLDGKFLYEYLSLRSRAGFPLDFSEAAKEPFRMPHSGVSLSAMLGGMHTHMLGEAVLANGGVLFMDEMPEYKRDVMEGLRGPLETGSVFLSKTHFKAELPAKFILVATANPCPCGYHGFSDRCNCSDREIQRYFSKLSGPILDRFDLKIEVAFKKNMSDRKEIELECNSGSDSEQCLSSREMNEKIITALERQKERYDSEEIHNGTLDAKQMGKWCRLSENSLSWMDAHVKVQSGEDSMRFYNKVVKVARTIADLEGSVEIERKHLIEAFYYNRRKIV